MKAFINAVRFVLLTQFKRYPLIDENTFRIDVGSEKVLAIIYTRVPGVMRKKLQGTLLIVGGMSVYGIHDHRLQNISKAFAGVGFKVVLVSYEDIDNFQVKPQTVESIVGTITTLSRNPDICPSGKISIFATSFSAGMCLLAASRPETRDLVQSICTVGTFGSVDTTLKFVLEQQDNDDYARMIFLKNFIHYSIKDSNKLKAAFEISYQDSGFHREHPELPSYLKKLSVKERDMFLRLKNDPGYRVHHWQRMVNNSDELKSILKELCVFSRLELLEAPVSLIHGANDRVIPATESELLYKKLKELKRRSKLVLTPLITHGDGRMRLHAIPATIQLLNGFAFFFKNASKSPYNMNKNR